MKNIGIYISGALIIVSLIVYILYLLSCDLNASIDNASKLIQTLAIIIGGFRAYRKFGWEKRAENIIKLKASLMEFHRTHNLSALDYQNDKEEDEEEAWIKFAMSRIPAYNS